MVKRIKSPKPANVQDPSQGHTVRLLHGQSLRLCLGEPSRYNFPNTSQWEVVTNSKYFSLASTKKIKGRKSEYWEFLFDPKDDFDSEHSASLSTLFLGNITILAKHDDGDNVSELHRNLCVFLRCSNPTREKIVTVLNPTTETIDFIKLEYDNVLEVVLDEDRNSFDWRSYAFPKDDTPANLRLNKSFYACLPPGKASQSLDNRSLYYCERRLVRGAGSVPLNNEHHFFFEFSGLNDIALGKLNGSYPFFNLVFVGKPKAFNAKLCRQTEIPIELIHKIHEIKVKKGKTKNKIKVPNKMELLKEVSLFERIERTGFLLNPKKTDRITLTNFHDSCVLEICNPSDYWQLPNRINALWSLEVSTSAVMNRCPRHMSVVSLPSRYIKDSVIQRWEVRTESLPEHTTTIMLGIINLSCPEIDKLKVGQSKSVHVLFERKTQNSTKPKSNTQSNSSIRGDHDHHVRRSMESSHSSYFQGMKDTSKKKKQFASIYEPVYFDVTIEDVSTTKLIEGEQFELMEKAIVQSPTLLLGHEPRQDSSIHALDWNAYRSFCDKRDIPIDSKESEWDFISFRQGTLPYESAEPKPPKYECDKKKGDLIGTTVLETSIANGQSCVPKSDMARCHTTARKMIEPLEVYSPVDNADIVLQRGQPLFVKLVLPSSKCKNPALRNPWTINIVDALDELKIWVESNNVVEGMTIPLQEIELRIICKVRTEVFNDGKHFAGIVRLSNGNELRQIKLSLDINKNSKFESLTHWKPYWKAMRDARPINFGLETKQYQNRYCNNRVTLVNPLGKTLEVEVDHKEEVEILLEKPSSPRPEDATYDLKANVVGGVVFECKDSSIWKLWEGSLVQRFLLVVNKTSDKLYAEIKITYNGEETKTRIIFCSKKKPEAKSKFMPVITVDKRHSNRIMVSGWRHGQDINISPFDDVYIQIPNIENFLTLKMKNLIERDSWGVELIQDVVDGELNKLLEPIVSQYDKYALWYPNDGVFSESVEPWNYFEYVLPSIETSQPFFLVILDRLKKIYGNKKSFRIGELKFTCEVKDQFLISQSLNLFVLNPDYKHEAVKPQTTITEFIDKTKIVLQDDSELFIDLQGKWNKDPTYGSNVHTPWLLVIYPTWMRPLNRTKKPKDREFEFLVQLPKNKTLVKGEIVFVCGELKKTLYVEASNF